MSLMQKIPESLQFLPQSFRCVMTVMKMDLHFPESFPAKPSQLIQDFFVILLFGIEKRMAR